MIAATLATSAAIETAVAAPGSSVEWVTKMDSSWKYGNTWANMHQMASVKARFWIQPPLFQIKAATVGASSSAKPQNQECVGRQL